MVAEFERELIRARTSEGRARAKARGVHIGRPKLTAHQKHDALKVLVNGTVSQVDLARRFNVSQALCRGLHRRLVSWRVMYF
jgi:DNA invertase Pin-like site-specific DNA recombinase